VVEVDETQLGSITTSELRDLAQQLGLVSSTEELGEAELRARIKGNELGP
jgi:hypothetical protein